MMEQEKQFNKKEQGVLDNVMNLVILTRKLEKVYENRPDLKNFIGCMNGQGDKFESMYTKEAIEKDSKYIELKRKEIEESNRSFGQENFNKQEGGFQLSEIMQALVIDLMNKGWFKDCRTVMTSDFDDLSGGFDAVMKRGESNYLGLSFDFTISSNEKNIYEKLKKEWERNIEKGNIPVVKYFEDPDTKKRGRLMVPKFIIGASKKDVEVFAKAYLEDDIEKLNNHPFKYVMLQQIEEQLQTILDFYYDDKNVNNEKFEFARKKYNEIQRMLRNMKNEIHRQEEIHDEVNIYEYSKENIALNQMRNFRITREVAMRKNI